MKYETNRIKKVKYCIVRKDNLCENDLQLERKRQFLLTHALIRLIHNIFDSKIPGKSSFAEFLIPIRSMFYLVGPFPLGI